MVIAPRNSVDVPAELRRQLPQVTDVRAFVEIGEGEAVAVYDTADGRPDLTADWMDNRPHIAFVRGGKLVQNFDAASLARVGPVGFSGMAMLARPPATPVAVFAFNLGVDAAGTFFVFVGRTSDSFTVSSTLQRAQAQLRLRRDPRLPFQLWSADGPFERDPDKQCVWCLKRYEVTALQWSGNKLRSLSEFRTTRGYDPSPFFEHHLVFVDR